jgi:hypothetical protein
MKATERNSTPTRRSILSGVALASTALLAAPGALAAASPDADLLAACAKYHRAHAAWENPHFVSDQVTDHLGRTRQAALVAVMEMPHHTPAGLRAKAAVALSAVLFETDIYTSVPWREHAETEQIIAIDVLTGLLGEI